VALILAAGESEICIIYKVAVCYHYTLVHDLLSGSKSLEELSFRVTPDKV
jgi:hypothetical protein